MYSQTVVLGKEHKYLMRLGLEFNLIRQTVTIIHISLRLFESWIILSNILTHACA